ncbi:DUF6221 family protein [Streptomyces griseorubiginosus]|uniref:DUF6221 family protein n=1 Tax=Streptomyces griseorubiginosus TaxID=67304 RepID=UPI0034088BA3
MTDTDGMVAWLRKAMDAAQRDAEAAARAFPDWEFDEFVNEIRDVPNAGTVAYVPVPEYGPHISRQSPAAVLRRIAADRKILDELHPSTTQIINPGYGKHVADFGCVTCHDWDGVTEGYGYCPTVRALAEGYGWTEGAASTGEIQALT